MIINNGMKAEAFISAIACTIGRDSTHYIPASQVTPDAIDAHGGVIYLASGLWRGKPTWKGKQLVGLTLENEDRTWAERQAVERGIAILIHADYL